MNVEKEKTVQQGAEGKAEKTDHNEINMKKILFESNSMAEIDCNLCDLAFPNITKLKLHTIKCFREFMRKEQSDNQNIEIKNVDGNKEEHKPDEKPGISSNIQEEATVIVKVEEDTFNLNCDQVTCETDKEPANPVIVNEHQDIKQKGLQENIGK